ncbi:hypothetical protein BC939DRAFT_501410 [Gamsiella multidivaricata]|uniref:uncharacterized protein n=1 Tax=Gamsiella multidivaricata TaxID=101098 RepID=UPI00221FD053|nr:uncharacterized protein BC939DRAFT_501410 [Gamsiella multidivaricata]KAI7827075.1 hypothetical protein BC939DRAFT_501410 [Gamsiella multidivaricata]
MKRMLQEELGLGDVPSLAQADSSEEIRVGCENQGVPSTSETNLPEVFSNLVRPIAGEVGITIPLPLQILETLAKSIL